MESLTKIVSEQKLSQDEIELAIKQYLKKIKNNPNNPWAYSGLGDYLVTLDRLKEAKIVYYKALKLRPKFHGFYSKLGKLYQKIQHLDKSNICYTTSIKLNPNNYWAYENLCQNLIVQERVNLAIAFYRQTLSFDPENARTYRKLGQLYTQQNNFSEAIICYQKAIALQPNKLDYYYLAKALLENDRADRAITYYQTAIQLNSNFDGVHQGLGDALRQQGQLEQAVSHYQRAKYLRKTQNTNFSSYPEYTYLINRKYGFVYCPIYKVACSSFKKLILQINEPEKFKETMTTLSGFQFHIYMDHAYSLFRYTAEEVAQIWQDDKYFKFTFVRNPWNRLVSAYLNKFMQSSIKPFTKEVIKSVHEQQGLTPDYETSITFKQFINYLIVTEDEVLNGHWKPQYLFLGNNKFDFIGKFENLTQDFQYIKQKLNLDLDLEWANKTNKTENSNTFENYGDYYPKELRKLEKMPDYKSFYTPELAELVRNRYQNDIEMFDYEF